MDKRVPTVVPTLEELKRMIKQETVSSGRLQSLRLPRDLSLGGTKPKKIYTPNLNVIRNKDKNKVNSVKSERPQRKAGNSRGQKRSAASPLLRDKNKHVKLIQSEGVFSQGMGDRKVTAHYSDTSASTREQNSALPMPKFEKSGWNVNKNQETTLVNGLINDEDSESESDSEYDPIVLPLDRNKNSFVNCFKIKQEDIVDKIKKEDPVDTSGPTGLPFPNGYSTLPEIKPKIKIENTDDEHLTERYNAFTDSTQGYDEDNPAFSLIRTSLLCVLPILVLPVIFGRLTFYRTLTYINNLSMLFLNRKFPYQINNCLSLVTIPCFFDSLPDSFLGKTWKEDSKDKDVDYTMKHMSDGHVGKILVRKSGKMEMVIRNTNYILNAEDSEGLRETAVLFPGEQSIALEPSVVTLGTIAEKYALIPEWNNLFDRAKKKHKFYW